MTATGAPEALALALQRACSSQQKLLATACSLLHQLPAWRHRSDAEGFELRYGSSSASALRSPLRRRCSLCQANVPTGARVGNLSVRFRPWSRAHPAPRKALEGLAVAAPLALHLAPRKDTVGMAAGVAGLVIVPNASRTQPYVQNLQQGSSSHGHLP